MKAHTPMHEVIGRTAVIYGATGTIGRAVSDILVRSGWMVVSVARDKRKLARLTEELTAPDGRFATIQVDGSEAAIRSLPEEVAAIAPYPVGLYLHASGCLTPGAFLELTADQVRTIIDTNLMDVMTAAHTWVPRLARSGGGTFIAIGSLGGIIPMPYQAVYAASKFALRGFCLSLNEEVRHSGVSVSLISPGPIQSPMLDLEITDPRAAMCLVTEPVRPDVVARAVVRLAGTGAREMTLPVRHSLLTRVVGSSPAVFGALFPLFSLISRHRRSRFERTKRNRKEHVYERYQSLQLVQR